VGSSVVRTDPLHFLTEAMNPAVGCHYFPPALGYLPNLRASPPIEEEEEEEDFA